MIKRIFIITIILLSVIHGSVFAAEQEMVFQEIGGGKYIYCNNPEAITGKDLADFSNPDPTLLMQNDDLKTDKYTLYAFHINDTGVRNEQNNPIESGFDIELDVRFSTKTGAKIKITKIAYEVPIRQRVSDITFIDAWATYLQVPIQDISSKKIYVPIKFEPVEIELSSAGSDWLGHYIENYCPIPYRKSVKLIADFEVLEGTINADIVALRSNNTIRDRSRFDVNAKRGILNEENQYKGIANTLPIVTTDLNFVFDSKTPLEQPLPVKVYNQYLHYGKVVDSWMTNINPQADKIALFNAVESDMLKFEFYDGMKLSYYDENIPVDKRDEIWKFDVYHSDIMHGKTNQELTISSLELHNDRSIACNLANYGVRTQYRITATNNDNVGKSFDYYVSTKSSDIVYVYEKNNGSANQFAVCKDKTDTNDNVLMYSVWLEPGATKEFIIENILPTDVAGGIVNSIYISKEKKENDVINKPLFKKAEEFQTSSYADHQMGKLAANLFSSNINNYDIIPKDQKYIVRWNAYDDVKGDINKFIVEFFSNVYIFDDNFELITTKKLEGLPAKIGLNTINVQVGNKLLNFNKLSDVDNVLILNKNDLNGNDDLDISQLPDIGNVIIVNEKELEKPIPIPVIENDRILVPAKAFFEAIGAKVDWNKILKTATISYLDKTIIIQADSNQIDVNGELVNTDIPAKPFDSDIVVPLRSIAEVLNYSVSWDSSINWATLTPKE